MKPHHIRMWKAHPFAMAWFYACYPIHMAIKSLADWSLRVNANNAYRAIGSNMRAGSVMPLQTFN